MSNTLRGLIHLCVGLSISILGYFLSKPVVLFLLGLATLAVLSFDLFRFRIRRLNPWFQTTFHLFLRNYENSRMLGASYLFVGSLAAVTIFPREIAVLSVSFLAVGDPLATVVGGRFGRIKLFKKNLEGIVVCFLGCILAGFIWRNIGLNVSAWLIIAGAIGAAVAEGLPIPVDDNITIPLLSGTVMILVRLLTG